MDTSPSAQMIHEEYGDNLRRLAGALRPYPFLRQSEDALLQLANNLTQPFNVAIFGRMKVGKSTLINALVRRKVAIIGVTEATATVNRLLYGTGDALQQFTVHWKSAEPETFPLERLQRDWNGTSDEVKDRIKRVARLDLYADADVLKDIRIIDTPGTESTTAEHEDIARQFIRGQEADALIYVFSTAMKEGDVRNLQDFREGCLTGSSQSNCVAVYHKWDNGLWENDDMEEIRKNACSNFKQPDMKDRVSDIIPVSAPLALLARTAPPEFWQQCRSVLSRYSDEEALTERLKDHDVWENIDAELADLYKKAKELGVPLPSFRLALRELYRHPKQDAASFISDLSDPLVQLARTAPPEFWQKCRSVLSRYVNEKALKERLEEAEEWEDGDPELADLYKKAKELGVPLPSFRLTLRELYRHPKQDAASCIFVLSAPLVQLARTAPPEFWQQCRSVLSRYADEEALMERLEEAEEWENGDAELADLYKKAKELGAPLSSFSLTLRELYRHPEQDAASCVFALSGFKELEDVLDKKFFTKKSILHQQQNCARARQLMDKIYERIEKERSEQKADIDMMERLWHQLEGKDVAVQKWIDRKRAHLKETHDELKRHHTELDRMRIAIGKRADCINSIFPLLDWVEEVGELQDHKDVLARVLRSLLPNGEPALNVNPREIHDLERKARALQHSSPSQKNRQHAKLLCRNLMSWSKQNAITSTEEPTEGIDS